MQTSSTSNIIDRLFDEHQVIVAYLMAEGQVSLQNNVESDFRKTLLLSVASYFETALSESLTDLFSEKTGAAEPMVEFVRNKAIARQYHTFFNWDARNASAFFGLFGVNFRQFMVAQVDNDSVLDSSIRAFLELGSLRNNLLHQNFAIFPLDKTVKEIYALYRDALSFVEAFPNKVRSFIEANPTRS